MSDTCTSVVCDFKSSHDRFSRVWNNIEDIFARFCEDLLRVGKFDVLREDFLPFLGLFSLLFDISSEFCHIEMIKASRVRRSRVGSCCLHVTALVDLHGLLLSFALFSVLSEGILLWLGSLANYAQFVQSAILVANEAFLGKSVIPHVLEAVRVHGHRLLEHACHFDALDFALGDGIEDLNAILHADSQILGAKLDDRMESAGRKIKVDQAISLATCVI